MLYTTTHFKIHDGVQIKPGGTQKNHLLPKQHLATVGRKLSLFKRKHPLAEPGSA